jgi:hypothetical protein
MISTVEEPFSRSKCCYPREALVRCGTLSVFVITKYVIYSQIECHLISTLCCIALCGSKCYDHPMFQRKLPSPRFGLSCVEMRCDEKGVTKSDTRSKRVYARFAMAAAVARGCHILGVNQSKSELCIALCRRMLKFSLLMSNGIFGYTCKPSSVNRWSDVHVPDVVAVAVRGGLLTGSAAT